MKTITIDVPKKVKNIMEEHPEVNWSKIAENVILEKIKTLKQKKF